VEGNNNPANYRDLYGADANSELFHDYPSKKSVLSITVRVRLVKRIFPGILFYPGRLFKNAQMQGAQKQKSDAYREIR